MMSWMDCAKEAIAHWLGPGVNRLWLEVHVGFACHTDADAHAGFVMNDLRRNERYPGSSFLILGKIDPRNLGCLKLILKRNGPNVLKNKL